MERALLQGEREAEAARLRQEQEAVQQLQEKLAGLDASIRKERDKVSPGAGLPTGAVPTPVLADGAAVPRAVVFPCGELRCAEVSRSIPSGLAPWVGLSVHPSAWHWSRSPAAGGQGWRWGCVSAAVCPSIAPEGSCRGLCGAGLSRTAAAFSGQRRPRGGGSHAGGLHLAASLGSAAHLGVFTCDGGRRRSVQLAGGGQEIGAGVSFASVAKEGVPAPFLGVVFGAIAAVICQP